MTINVVYFSALYKTLSCSKQNFSAIVYSPCSSDELTIFLEFAYENVMQGCMKSYHKIKRVYSFSCSFFKEFFSILIHYEKRCNDLLQVYT